MSTHRSSWKRRESGAAGLFNCRRAVLSGSSGRDDATCSDSTHPTLFLECKLREKHATRTLHDATKALAKRECKTPVLALADKGRPGFLICIHSDDWRAVVTEWLAGLPDAERDDMEGAIRCASRKRRGIDAADSA